MLKVYVEVMARLLQKQIAYKTIGKLESNLGVIFKFCYIYFFVAPPTSTFNYRVWDEESQQEVLTAFGECVIGDSPFPSHKKICGFLQTTLVSTLKSRSEPQIRSWLQNQRKLYRQDRKLPEKRYRNTTPNSIYILFSENIQNKNLPSVRDLAMAYERSPSLQTYSIKQLQEIVQNIIERNNE